MSPPIAHDGIQVLHFYILVPQEQIVYEPFTARSKNSHTQIQLLRISSDYTILHTCSLPCVRFVFFNVEFDANFLQSRWPCDDDDDDDDSQFA